MPSGGAVTTVVSQPAAGAGGRQLAADAAQALRRHWLFVGLLAVGAAVRALTMVAYPPALFFSDSWAYLSTAFAHHLVSLPFVRPVGYSILIRVLTAPGRNIAQLVALQHVAGLAIGVLVYATLIRARLPRAVAVLAGALVLLDGYAITLEQYVMPDTFFTLTLLVAALVLAWPRIRDPAVPERRITARAGAMAGFLLAAAAIQREVGLFAIPVVIAYLAWVRIGWRPFLVFLLVLAVPLGGYAAVMKAKTGVLGITATSGWTFYSRVAGFADCSGAGVAAPARPLCETAAQRARHPSVPEWYRWNVVSPAVRLFHPGHETRAQRARANAILEAFARHIILHQPGAFATAVGVDFLRYFTPGATPYADAVSATSLPQSASRETVDESVRRHIVPAANPAVHSPAGLLRGYRGVIHVPRPVLALLALVVIIALALRLPTRQDVLLFGGTALLLLLGTAATGGFGLRYLMPAVPLLAIGGALASRDLVAWLPVMLKRDQVRSHWSVHHSRRPSTSPRGSSPRLGAPMTSISRPSGPAS